jgi:hypothetical protein
VTRIAFPFLTLPEEAIRFGGWLLGDPGAPLKAAPDLLEGWDYARDIEVCTEVDVDLATAAEFLAIPRSELEMFLVLSSGTGAGSKPRWVRRLAGASIGPGGGSAQLREIIPGISLSGRLRLQLDLLLHRRTLTYGPLSPRLKGSRLWRSSHDVLLEDGGSARFPMELISFSKVFVDRPERFAPWYLKWSPGSLGADFSGSVRLYVNADAEAVAERFSSGDDATLQAILGDVMSQMISSVLASEDWGDTPFDEGTVGHQIQSWLEMTFPGQSVASVRTLRAHQPGRFQAAILAAADPEASA